MLTAADAAIVAVYGVLVRQEIHTLATMIMGVQAVH